MFALGGVSAFEGRARGFKILDGVVDCSHLLGSRY